LVSEIGNGLAERLRVVVGAVAGGLLRAERAGQVVVRIRDIGAVLWIQGDLKEVSEAAAIIARTACTAGANRPRMNDVVTGRMLREGRN